LKAKGMRSLNLRVALGRVPWQRVVWPDGLAGTKHNPTLWKRHHHAIS
jgi:hypothetical protein